MKDGFIKIACACPEVRVADCDYNTERIIELIKEAAGRGVKIVCFPELSITGYTCGDLFLQDTLLSAAERSLVRIAKETEALDIAAIVGLPLMSENKIYNCAAVVNAGRVQGAVPKVNIPNYSEFYEARYFASGKNVSFLYSGNGTEFLLSDQFIFNTYRRNSDDLSEIRGLTFGIEICEDLWVGDTPSVKLAKAGATIIFNPSASDEIIGKADYRRTLIKAKSGSLACAYAYSDCGIGESTQDMVFAGHCIITENGSVMAESKHFTHGLTVADVDFRKLIAERRRMNTFTEISPNDSDTSMVHIELELTDTVPERPFPQTPFVPADKHALDSRCEEILTMQAAGLMTRLRHIGCKDAVLGLSGGLDSTLALIVAAHAFDMLGLDRKGIHTITMPCFGTTDRTYTNACKLAEAYGTTLEEINIRDSVMQHFKDLGHDPDVHDVTYENSQARERTQILMDKANQLNGIVIGTGDLSELALGWATYNGDHMSMYGVNGSIPKTLVRWLVNYEAEVSEASLSAVLRDVLDTPVSPELLPPEKDGTIAQKTEDLVGPYELHDFFLYYFVRFGFPPAKIYRMAVRSFEDKYSPAIVMKWLKKFCWRFFSQQFKRSCLPDGPKVGSVTLSPRGDWRMPSDASYNLWIKELEEIETSGGTV